MNISLFTTEFKVEDLNFEKDEIELIEQISKGYHILHPEILLHLIKTGWKYYNQVDNQIFY